MDGLPIFITGFARSGTTLLRRLVSMHPALEYELLHEQRRLLKFGTVEDAINNYIMSMKQAGKLTGAIGSIRSGEKIPYRDNTDLIIHYLDRWKLWWPESIIMHIDRDIQIMAKSAKRKFDQDIKTTIKLAENNIPLIKSVLFNHSNVIWLTYERILANPHHFVKNLYSVMGDFNEDDTFIHKVITTKDPWEYKGRIMPGLRYSNSIKALHIYD